MKLYITTRVDGKFQPVTDADALAELQSRQSAPITDADITAAAQSARSMHTHYVAAQLREQRTQIAETGLAKLAPAPIVSVRLLLIVLVVFMLAAAAGWRFL